MLRTGLLCAEIFLKTDFRTPHGGGGPKWTEYDEVFFICSTIYMTKLRHINSLILNRVGSGAKVFSTCKRL
jgi:hypothetical protein